MNITPRCPGTITNEGESFIETTRFVFFENFIVLHDRFNHQLNNMKVLDNIFSMAISLLFSRKSNYLCCHMLK